MRSLSLFVLFALTACGGGGGSSHKDLSVPIYDLSAIQYDFSTKPADLAQPPNYDAGAPIAAACMNICKCFMSVAEQGKCESLCVSDDSRYQTWGGYSGSTSISSSMPGKYSGPLGGMFAGKSSLSSGVPVVPTAACLTCLAHATCMDLEQDNACETDCPYTF
jgi:hypothetical protein